jgi:hypothetical protein
VTCLNNLINKTTRSLKKEVSFNLDPPKVIKEKTSEVISETSRERKESKSNSKTKSAKTSRKHDKKKHHLSYQDSVLPDIESQNKDNYVFNPQLLKSMLISSL